MSVQATSQLTLAEAYSRQQDGPKEGWEFVNDGPLAFNELLDKYRLFWCPVCGPEEDFEGTFVSTHILNEHEPEDFGLSPVGVRQ